MKLINKSEEDLLNIIEENPNSENAMKASSILIHRNNVELRLANKRMYWLTWIIAVTTIASVIIAALK